MQPIGHWFMRLATSYRHLWNSNCIKTCSPIAFFLGLIDSLKDLITCLDATKQCITGEQANKRHKLWLFSRKHAKHLLFKDANKIFFLLFHQALILSDLPLHFLNLHFLRSKSMPKKNLAAGTQPKAISFCWARIFYTMWKTSFLIVRKSIPNAEMGFENDVSICLQQDKLTSLDVLGLLRQTTIEVEEKTRAQSQSSLWTMLRNKRITASEFGQVAKRQSNFDNLVGEINSARHVVSAPVQRGLDLEPQAAIIYASIAKQNQVNLFPSGLVMNPWLGCTPDPQSVWFECWGARPFSFWKKRLLKKVLLTFRMWPILQRTRIQMSSSLNEIITVIIRS